jgi:pyruvate/2-oxoglutarate/acetoin dehydrogenase E1 component
MGVHCVCCRLFSSAFSCQLYQFCTDLAFVKTRYLLAQKVAQALLVHSLHSTAQPASSKSKHSLTLSSIINHAEGLNRVLPMLAAEARALQVSGRLQWLWHR